MATIEFDAPGFHAEIVSSAPIHPKHGVWVDFIEALTKIDQFLDPISLDVNVAGADFSYVLTGGESRSYSATLRVAQRQRKVNSTSFWTLAQLLQHNPMIEAVFGLLEASVTKIEVDWS